MGRCCDFFEGRTGTAAQFVGFNCSVEGKITRASVEQYHLTGELPAFTDLANLTLLDFSNNSFSGVFPSVKGMVALKALYFHSNHFTALPDGLEAMSQLEHLQFFSNDISGPLPNVTSFGNLFELFLQDNNFTGSIDGLIPNTVKQCRITLNNSNPGLCTASGVFPSCKDLAESIPCCDKANPSGCLKTTALGAPSGSAGSGTPPTGTLNIPLIAGAAGGGLAVIAIASIITIVTLRRRKAKRREQEAKDAAKEPHWFFLRVAGLQGLEDTDNVEYSGPPFTVLQNYDAQAPDEMSIAPGQTLRMQTVFRDGWGACWEETSGSFGTVPLDCLLLSDHILPSAENLLSFPLQEGEGSFIRGPSANLGSPSTMSNSRVESKIRSHTSGGAPASPASVTLIPNSLSSFSFTQSNSIGGRGGEQSGSVRTDRQSGRLPGQNMSFGTARITDPEDSLPAEVGFTCGADGRIKRASLFEFGLVGRSLPPLTNLTNLEYLDVGENFFSGPFPSVVGLQNLSSILARNNSFTSFPEGLENLTTLAYLSFHWNNISAPFPKLSLQPIFSLYLQGNNLSGAVDGLLPSNPKRCRLTHGGTNPLLFAQNCNNVPGSCLADGQVVKSRTEVGGSLVENVCSSLAASGNASVISTSGETSASGNGAAIGGGIAGAAVAIAIATGAIYALRRRKEKAASTHEEVKEPHWFFLRIAGPLGLEDEPSVDYSGPPFKVVQGYEKQATDEMDLVPGHMVQMRAIFRDGWASCLDLTASTSGTVPLDCLLLADHMVLPSGNNTFSFPLAPGEGSYFQASPTSASMFPTAHPGSNTSLGKVYYSDILRAPHSGSQDS
ncbi:hypothetical protein HDU93_007370, partial [Gonapodya sp. JEL0774]